MLSWLIYSIDVERRDQVWELGVGLAFVPHTVLTANFESLTCQVCILDDSCESPILLYPSDI